MALEQASSTAVPRVQAAPLLALSAAAAGCSVLGLIWLRGVGASLGALDHQPGLLVDFGIYLDQVRGLQRAELYLAPHWLYPPLSAAALLGFGALSTGAARMIWAGLQLLACAWLALACTRQLPSLAKPLRYAAGVGLTVSSLPVLHCVKWGQLSLLVLLLCVFALERRDRIGAWLLGAAAGLKVYPLLYAAARLARGDWRFGLHLLAATLVFGVVVPALLLGPLLTLVMLGRVVELAHNELGAALSVSHHTLPALIARCFAPASELAGARGPLLFALPAVVRAALAAACVLALIAVTWLRTRKLDVSHPLTLSSVLLCFSLIVRPGWVHYFVATPLALAVLLEHAHKRGLPLLCWVISFGCGSAGLLASLSNPELYWLVSRAGLVTWSALSALCGLWACCRGSEPARV